MKSAAPGAGQPVMRCPDCGAELPVSSPASLCSRCALVGAIELGKGNPTAQRPIRAPDPDGSGTGGMKVLGDYELIEEIARGGMGIVYRARQKSLDRIVAVKLLGFHLADGEVVRRFRAEAVAAGSLHHPNIVTIHEVGIHDGEHFIAMDYVPGPDLAQLVRDRPLTPQQAAQYVEVIAKAIHHAHERGILHRDLKPSNVLIDQHDQPRITDFGLAKRLDTPSEAHDSELTRSGQVLGSPNYLSPEQAIGNREQVGRSSDVYSLGAMLFHMLTGRPPFKGRSLAETLQFVREQEPPCLRRLNASVPRDLEIICLKCLEKTPARRYQTAQELAEELHRFLQHEAIHSRPISRLERSWRWVLRKPALAGSLALALVVTTWASYNAWIIHMTRARAFQIERDQWNMLFHPEAPLSTLYFLSENRAGYFGERPSFAPHAQRFWVGMYLEQDQQHMVSRFAPLLRYLETRLSTKQVPVRIDLKVFARREGLEEALTSTDPKRQPHMGRIGDVGLSRLLGTDTNLTPLVRQAGGGKVTVLFTTIQSGITNLAGLRGKRVAFGNPTSTASGFALLTRLVEMGITARDLNVTNYPTSEKNVERVLKGDADAGVIRKDKFQTYVDPNLRIIQEFKTTRMPWVATGRLKPDMIRKVRQALIDLSDRDILGLLPEDATSGFQSVDRAYFTNLVELQMRAQRLFYGTNGLVNQPIELKKP